MSAFDRISAKIPKETRVQVSKTLDIVERIQAILDAKGMSQKDLAAALDKNPSEISRWMTGLHNFELKTLVKIEETLSEEIFTVIGHGRVTGFLAQGSFTLSTKIASLPEALHQQALDYVDFLAQRSSQSQVSSVQSQANKINPVPAEVAQEPAPKKYQKKK
ncbi:MAG: helix-turn-helix transcriptional regulator [Saprospiraceae bacterium]|nr:helix-turn-helix transcriptional regulator [Saprospiraceae bacterium]